MRLGKDGKPVARGMGKPKGKGTPKDGFSKPVKTRASKGPNAMPKRKSGGGKPRG